MRLQFLQMLRQDNLCINCMGIHIKFLNRMCHEKLFVHEFSTETSSEKAAVVPFVLIQMHGLGNTSQMHTLRCTLHDIVKSSF